MNVLWTSNERPSNFHHGDRRPMELWKGDGHPLEINLYVGRNMSLNNIRNGKQKHNNQNI